MRLGLLLILLVTCLVSVADAASYACRDSEGKLYFTDSPSGASEECLQNMKQIFLQKSSSVTNPNQSETKTPTASAAATSQEASPQPLVSEEVVAGLLQRAEASAAKFAQGLQGLEAANQRRRIGSKTRFAETKRIADEANQLINEARQEKNQLLKELESHQIPAPQRTDIIRHLDNIR